MPLDANSVPPQTAPHETRLADYRPPAFLVDTVDLAFELDEAATRFIRADDVAAQSSLG